LTYIRSFSLNIDVLSVTFPTVPYAEVTKKGKIVYSEVIYENLCKLKAYVEEIASGDGATKLISINTQRCKTIFSNSGLLLSFFWRWARARRIVSRPCMRMSLHKGPDPRTCGQPCNHCSSSQFLCSWNAGTTFVLVRPISLLYLKHKVGTTWEFSSNLASVYLNITTPEITFKGKNALCTSVGKGSIGVEVIKRFLSGGAHIIYF